MKQTPEELLQTFKKLLGERNNHRKIGECLFFLKICNFGGYDSLFQLCSEFGFSVKTADRSIWFYEMCKFVERKNSELKLNYSIPKSEGICREILRHLGEDINWELWKTACDQTGNKPTVSVIQRLRKGFESKIRNEVSFFCSSFSFNLNPVATKEHNSRSYVGNLGIIQNISFYRSFSLYHFFE
jgi:hypothetical protein